MTLTGVQTVTCPCCGEEVQVFVSLGGVAAAVACQSPPPPPAPSGPTARAATAGTGPSGIPTFTLPVRSAGDTLVAVVTCDAGVNGSANTGWTRRVNTDDGSAIGLAVYTRQSDGTDNPPVTSSLLGAYAYTIIAVQNPAVGYDVSAGASSGGASSASIVAPSVTAGAAGLLVSAYLRSAGSGSITPPAGQTATAQVATAAGTLRCGYESVAAGATGTRTATGSDAQPWAAAGVVVK